jgi:hypothetical protein
MLSGVATKCKRKRCLRPGKPEAYEDRAE